jgi:hypothetical protein
MTVTQCFRFALAAGLLAALAACGSARTAPGEDELVAGNLVGGEDDPVICRRQRVVGSNVPVRVCKTESQMDAERAALERQIGSLRPMTGDTRQMDINTFPQN